MLPPGCRGWSWDATQLRRGSWPECRRQADLGPPRSRGPPRPPHPPPPATLALGDLAEGADLTRRLQGWTTGDPLQALKWKELRRDPPAPDRRAESLYLLFISRKTVSRARFRRTTVQTQAPGVNLRIPAPHPPPAALGGGQCGSPRVSCSSKAHPYPRLLLQHQPCLLERIQTSQRLPHDALGETEEAGAASPRPALESGEPPPPPSVHPSPALLPAPPRFSSTLLPPASPPPRARPGQRPIRRAGSAPEACSRGWAARRPPARSPGPHAGRTCRRRSPQRRPWPRSHTRRRRPRRPRGWARWMPGQSSRWGPHRSPRAPSSCGGPGGTCSGGCPCGAGPCAPRGGNTAATWGSETRSQGAPGALGFGPPCCH